MKQAQLDELVLRQTVMELFKSPDPKALLEEKTQALSAPQGLVGEAIKSKEDKQKDESNKKAIATVTAVAVAGAIIFVHHQLGKVSEARQRFEEEDKNGIASFYVPIKEEKKLSHSQRTIHALYEKLKKSPEMFAYMGVKVSEVSQQSNALYLSALPFYQMSHQGALNVAQAKLSDKACYGASLFLKTTTPDHLTDIKNKFSDNSIAGDFIRSIWKGEDFLNKYRAPRFLILCIGNLLWNLQYPICTETNTPLSIDDKIALCKKAAGIINWLLIPDEEAHIEDLHHQRIVRPYVEKVEIYIQQLKEAFEEEKARSLQIDDVVNASVATTRLLDENIFKLIFPGSEGKAEKLASLINTLNVVLNNDNGDLLKKVPAPDEHLTLVNRPVTTVADVFMCFSHLSNKERKSYIKKLEEGVNETANTADNIFVDCLRQYQEAFLSPLYHQCKQSLRPSTFNAHRHEANKMAFDRMLPLVAMVARSNQIQVDTLLSQMQSVKARKEGFVFHRGESQFKKILQAATKNKTRDDKTFSLDITPMLQERCVDGALKEKLNQLPQKQAAIGELSELLTSVMSFMARYRSFLQYKPIKAFVLRILDEADNAYKELNELVKAISDIGNISHTGERRLIQTISQMDKGLFSQISSFKQSVANMQTKMQLPAFEDNIRKELLLHLNSLDESFVGVFGERFDELGQFIDELDDRQKQVSQDKVVHYQHDRVVKLSTLINNCYHALSSCSRHGMKGRYLVQIKNKMMRDHLSENSLKDALRELTRVVCAYRPGFFQAAYAETRSAKVLINAIVNSQNDKTLPLFKWLLGEEATLSPDKRADSQVEHLLRTLRGKEQWAEKSTGLKPIAAF